jgi:hypothetical protein
MSELRYPHAWTLATESGHPIECRRLTAGGPVEVKHPDGVWRKSGIEEPAREGPDAQPAEPVLADGDADAYLAAAIESHFGERCAEHEPGCGNCAVWNRFDRLRRSEAECAMLERAVEEAGKLRREAERLAEARLNTIKGLNERLRAMGERV